MFSFTDAEVGLALRHRREIDATVRDGQAIVDRLDDEIDMLRRKLRNMTAELTSERARRQSLEIELDRINAFLDMPIDG